MFSIVCGGWCLSIWSFVVGWVPIDKRHKSTCCQCSLERSDLWNICKYHACGNGAAPKLRLKHSRCARAFPSTTKPPIFSCIANMSVRKKNANCSFNKYLIIIIGRNCKFVCALKTIIHLFIDLRKFIAFHRGCVIGSNRMKSEQQNSRSTIGSCNKIGNAQRSGRWLNSCYYYYCTIIDDSDSP